MGMFTKMKARKLQKTYAAKLKEAMEAQRNGDIQGYAALSEQAEALREQATELESASA